MQPKISRRQLGKYVAAGAGTIAAAALGLDVTPNIAHAEAPGYINRMRGVVFTNGTTSQLRDCVSRGFLQQKEDRNVNRAIRWWIVTGQYDNGLPQYTR